MVAWLAVPVTPEAEAEGSHKISRDQCRHSLDKSPIPQQQQSGYGGWVWKDEKVLEMDGGNVAKQHERTGGMSLNCNLKIVKMHGAIMKCDCTAWVQPPVPQNHNTPTHTYTHINTCIYTYIHIYTHRKGVHSSMMKNEILFTDNKMDKLQIVLIKISQIQILHVCFASVDPIFYISINI